MPGCERPQAGEDRGTVGTIRLASTIVMGSFCKQHIVLNHVFFRYKSSGRKIRGSSGGCGVLPFRIGRTSFKLAVTSSNPFLPVVAHVK